MKTPHMSDDLRSALDRLAAESPEDVSWVHDDGGRAAAGVAGDPLDVHIRAAATLTGRDYRSIESLFQKRLAEAGHPPDHAWRVNGHQDIWERVLERDLALVPHTPFDWNDRTPIDALPTFDEVWARFGDCIVVTAHNWVALIGGAAHGLLDSRYVCDFIFGYGRRRVTKLWTPKESSQ